MARRRFTVQGRVQGVGFRPFVFTQAEDRGLTGCVRNSPQGVIIEIQGKAEAIDDFAVALRHNLPPLARIVDLRVEDCPAEPSESAFVIAPSTGGETHAVLISPDMCLCDDCGRDIQYPANRRHEYVFTNCTNCGPRYTITRSIPYDRASTSMACFPMCDACRAEYENPRDRRFHAQPNACPVCGPAVWYVRPDAQGRYSPAATSLEASAPTGSDALRVLAQSLVNGHIAAIKGLGGFHLACDACDERAVARLRKRKSRPHKPFALMVANLEQARTFAHAGPHEEALLTSPEHPIVICDLLRHAQPGISALVSPDTTSVGILLPYTPLHAILLEYMLRLRQAAENTAPAVLVMTSGNPPGEPLCLGNREALERLGHLADGFLLHNRDILIRVDDSVVRVMPGTGTLFHRRARGYVPTPTPMTDAHLRQLSPDSAASLPCILGVGAELKNTLCLTKGQDGFVSQHIGDMANVETSAFHEAIRDHLADLLKVRPAMVVRDLHPDYLSSRMAEDYARHAGLPIATLQHHLAHAHAVLAENEFQGRALVLALDGTGLGEDGHLWGGEALLVDTEAAGGPLHTRLAHLAPMDLPGGEAAIKEPWRIAHALLLRNGLLEADNLNQAQLPWLPDRLDAARLLPMMVRRRINTPLSTSCGRLFDAVSALLGLCIETSYEGQAAILLEEAQFCDSGALSLSRILSDSLADGELYSCPIVPSVFPTPSPMLQLDTHTLFSEICSDRASGAAVPLIARRFHRSLAYAFVRLVQRLREEYAFTHVGLSGGCLQNRTLAGLLARTLESGGCVPLLHTQLPPGDGCISFGQAAWGRHFLRGRKD